MTAGGNGQNFVTPPTVHLNIDREIGGSLLEEWITAKIRGAHRAPAAVTIFLSYKLLSCGLFEVQGRHRLK
jgi:hypothetical protein